MTRAVPRLSAALSVGISGAKNLDLRNDNDNRTATFRRLPLRLGAVMGLPLGPGLLEPMFDAQADLLIVSSTAGRFVQASQSLRLGWALQAGVGYRVKVAGHVYARPLACFGATILQYDISVPGTPDSLFRTPWWHASFGIDAGVLFQ